MIVFRRYVNCAATCKRAPEAILAIFDDMPSDAHPMTPANESNGAGIDAQKGDPGYRTLGFLAVHGLASTPIHYWVGHDYVVGSNVDLQKAVESRLATDKPFDSFYVRELYDEYVAHESFRAFRGMGDEMEKLLGGLIASLQDADRSASGYQDALKASITRLGDAGGLGPEALKTVAQNLLAAAVAANARNESLQQSLEATEQEARQLRNELEKHRYEAVTDPLTGLLNRRGLEFEMAKVFAGGSDAQSAMLVLDIDHFKKINDAYGHSVGDVVLRRFAETLNDLIPSGAVPVRFGGEEFVVLVPATSGDHARSLGESIRATVENLRLVRRQDKLAIASFTISVGIAMQSVSDTFESLFERADKALYEAKSTGRNRVVCML